MFEKIEVICFFYKQAFKIMSDISWIKMSYIRINWIQWIHPQTVIDSEICCRKCLLLVLAILIKEGCLSAYLSLCVGVYVCWRCIGKFIAGSILQIWIKIDEDRSNAPETKIFHYLINRRDIN